MAAAILAVLGVMFWGHPAHPSSAVAFYETVIATFGLLVISFYVEHRPAHSDDRSSGGTSVAFLMGLILPVVFGLAVPLAILGGYLSDTPKWRAAAFAAIMEELLLVILVAAIDWAD